MGVFFGQKEAEAAFIDDHDTSRVHESWLRNRNFIFVSLTHSLPVFDFD